MEDLQKTLTTYAYNITGSLEDARDVVQDVIEKHIGMDLSHIENEKNYLIKSTINRAISLKKKKNYESTYGKWLPEPVEVQAADSPLIREQTATYSLLVLLEKLNPLERAVFILKEGFAYKHREIAEVLDIQTEHSRQLFHRAQKSLKRNKAVQRDPQPQIMEAFVKAITEADIQALESLLLADVELMVDGGGSVKVISAGSNGVVDTVQLLLKVHGLFHGNDRYFTTLMDHQLALVYHSGGTISNCLVLDVRQGRISKLYSIVAPEKLKSIKIP